MAKKKGDGLLIIAAGKPKDEGLDDEEEAFAEESAPEAEGEEFPEEEEAEGAYPEFSIPAGLDLSDLEPGEEKEVLCVIRKTSDSEACIRQVDGIDLAGEGQGMSGPPPAAPVPPPPPPGMPMGPPMPMGPGGPVRNRAAAAGLM